MCGQRDILTCFGIRPKLDDGAATACLRCALDPLAPQRRVQAHAVTALQHVADPVSRDCTALLPRLMKELEGPYRVWLAAFLATATADHAGEVKCCCSLPGSCRIAAQAARFGYVFGVALVVQPQRAIDMAAGFALQASNPIPAFRPVAVRRDADAIVVQFAQVELRHGVAGIGQLLNCGNRHRIADLFVGAGGVGIVKGDQPLDGFVEMRSTLGRVSQVGAEVFRAGAVGDVLPDQLIDGNVKGGVVDHDVS